MINNAMKSVKEIVESHVVPFGMSGTSLWSWKTKQTISGPAGEGTIVHHNGMVKLPNHPADRHAEISRLINNHASGIKERYPDWNHVVNVHAEPVGGKTFGTHWMDDPEGEKMITHTHQFELQQGKEQ